MDAHSPYGHVTPIVPAADMEASIDFYVGKLGFKVAFRVGEPVVYAGVLSGDASVHLSKSDDSHVASMTSFRIRTRDIDALYASCERAGIVHPNGALAERPWGTREFSVLDPAGVCIAFWQQVS